MRQGQGSLLDDDTVVWAPTPSIPLPVRERDPDTSIIAAKATTRAKRSRLRADILRVHQAHPAGLTDDELDVMLVDDDRGTIARRRKDLVVEGLVEDSGQRRATRRGSQAIVFRLVVDR